MSRSYKKVPKGGAAKCSSEKRDKRIWHKRFRRDAQVKLQKWDGEDVPTLKRIKEVSNPWSMAKDGKTHYGDRRDVIFSHFDGCHVPVFDSDFDFYKRCLMK